MNNYSKKVFELLKQKPQYMKAFLTGQEAELVMAAAAPAKPGSAEVKEVLGEVRDNPVVKMYIGAGGEIDAAELIGLTGGFEKGPGFNPTGNAGVEALFDGRATAEEMLALRKVVSEAPTRGVGTDIISALLGLAAENQAQSSNTTLNNKQLNELMTLVYQAANGKNVSKKISITAGQLNYLIRAYGVNTSVQPGAQQTASGGTISQILSLLGGGNSQANQQAAAQQSNGAADLLLNALLGGGQQTNQNANPYAQLFGAQTNQQAAQNANPYGQLFSSLLGGQPAQNNTNAGAAQQANQGQIYSLNGGSAQQSPSALGSLFSLAGQLLGN